MAELPDPAVLTAFRALCDDRNAQPSRRVVAAVAQAAKPLSPRGAAAAEVTDSDAPLEANAEPVVLSLRQLMLSDATAAAVAEVLFPAEAPQPAASDDDHSPPTLGEIATELDLSDSVVSYVGLQRIGRRLGAALRRGTARIRVVRLAGHAQPGPRTIKALRNLRRDADAAGRAMDFAGLDAESHAAVMAPLVEARAMPPPLVTAAAVAAGEAWAAGEPAAAAAVGPPASTPLSAEEVHQTHHHEADPPLTGTDDAADEETVLANRVAAQLARLMVPVTALHVEQVNAAAAAMALEHEAGLAAMWDEFLDGLEAADAAMDFAVPYRPPVFDPDGPVFHPLPLDEPDANALDDASVLARLKTRLYVVEDRLRVRCEAAATDAALSAAEHDDVPLPVAADGRLAQPYFCYGKGVALGDVARRFAVRVKDIVDANPTMLKPPAVPHAATAETALDHLDGETLLLPLTAERILASHLLSERAAALVASDAQRALDHETRRVAPDHILRDAGARLTHSLQRLEARRSSRERTQAVVRDVAFGSYAAKRDRRLRVLSRGAAMYDEYCALLAALLAEHAEAIGAVVLYERRERSLRFPPAPVESADARELRLLKERLAEVNTPRRRRTMGEAGPEAVSA